jgi:hypothetical protein
VHENWINHALKCPTIITNHINGLVMGLSIKVGHNLWREDVQTGRGYLCILVFDTVQGSKLTADSAYLDPLNNSFGGVLPTSTCKNQ